MIQVLDRLPPNSRFAEFAEVKTAAARSPLKLIQEYVVGFAFDTQAEKVVLIRKLKPAWQAGLLNGVGGKIEAGELPIDAMIREFEEETGVKTSFIDWTNFLTVRGVESTVHCFSAFIDISKARSAEKEKVETHPVFPLPRDTIPNLQWIIPLALDNIEPFSVFDNGGLETGVPSRLARVLRPTVH